MGQVFKIERETKKIEEVTKLLSKNKNDIKEIICIIRLRNGDITIINSGATFETMCSGNKMLDALINNELCYENEQLEEDDDNEEDEEPEEK